MWQLVYNPCGRSGIFRGIGETHPYMCEYTCSKLLNTHLAKPHLAVLVFGDSSETHYHMCEYSIHQVIWNTHLARPHLAGLAPK